MSVVDFPTDGEKPLGRGTVLSRQQLIQFGGSSAIYMPIPAALSTIITGWIEATVYGEPIWPAALIAILFISLSSAADAKDAVNKHDRQREPLCKEKSDD